MNCAAIRAHVRREGLVRHRETRPRLVKQCRACRFGNQKEERGEVIDLVYFHGKSVKEVAEIVGIAAPTVKTRMFYARKKLAEFVATA